MRRSLGSFVLEDNRLVFEAMSEARAARGRGFLEGLAGGAVTYRTTEYREVDEALEDGPEAASSAPDEVPRDVQAAIASEYYARHYRDWPDTPLPALGNRTPREASRGLAEWRPALVALLKDFESRSERQRRAGPDRPRLPGALGRAGPAPAGIEKGQRQTLRRRASSARAGTRS